MRKEHLFLLRSVLSTFYLKLSITPAVREKYLKNWAPFLQNSQWGVNLEVKDLSWSLKWVVGSIPVWNTTKTSPGNFGLLDAGDKFGMGMGGGGRSCCNSECNLSWSPRTRVADTKWSEEYVLSPGNSLGYLFVPVCLLIMMNGNSNCSPNIIRQVRGQTL